MPKFPYFAVDRNKNTVAEGTVEAENWARANEAASQEVRAQDAPFYDLIVRDAKED
ncbi:hypothetical protein [Streptomyces sp. NWU49]|uniref:hypothetical protein n=1 Tax=Streptomyces sp. NWU49 TaxID=2201153 RepID=UPI0015E7F598|nr:hypothetical protein [Streptomyces sp. NWU49]